MDESRRVRLWKLRLFKDTFARYSIAMGGYSVIVTILLIFFYLIYETIPLLFGAKIELLAEYSIIQTQSKPLESLKNSYYALEEQGEIAAQFGSEGYIVFFDTHTGKMRSQGQIDLPDNVTVSHLYAADPGSGLIAYALNNGAIIIAGQAYHVSYPNDKRLISPEITFPLGAVAIEMDSLQQPLKKIAVEESENSTTIAAYTEDHRLILSRFLKNKILFTNNVFIAAQESPLTHTKEPWKQKISTETKLNYSVLKQMLLNTDQDKLLFVHQNKAGKSLLDYYQIGVESKPEFMQQLVLAEQDDPVTTVSFLTGGLSLLVGHHSGRIAQWFPVKSADGEEQYTLIREFSQQQSPITQIRSEMQRKGFAALDEQGNLAIYHSTAEKHLLLQKVSANSSALMLAIAPRANYFLTVDAQAKMKFWSVDNEHPEISWHTLWEKVWYESYTEPDYIWQSSSASNDFEPKFSLTPLVFGTFKAAFFAMLFAIPLAIMGAIYTAYFMSSAMRGLVKPSIEIMEALPTVILGFLAGLWLAPLIEDNLPAVFTLLMILPVSVLLFAWGWHKLPENIRQQIPDGWEAIILLPILLLAIWLTFSLSLPMEKLFFNGDMQIWLETSFGLGYDQRNSIVVGVAMGFAVIPVIFSITEDAIYSVPRHLTLGSLALGATRWQTLIRVVILTASPAIFSAVMIGFGRAIGETMIVLMATGNTPLMDFNIFQGMRTLSANIAVEIPESEVSSSHYRVLFLAALLLFVFTFVFNTLAELIRQRLRNKYGNL